MEACSGPASCVPVASMDQMRGDISTEWWWETNTNKACIYHLMIKVSSFCVGTGTNIHLVQSKTSLAERVSAWRVYIIDGALQASSYVPVCPRCSLLKGWTWLVVFWVYYRTGLLTFYLLYIVGHLQPSWLTWILKYTPKLLLSSIIYHKTSIYETCDSKSLA